jgi:hypothetical protein
VLVQPGPSRLNYLGNIFFLKQLESTLGVKRVLDLPKEMGERATLFLSLSLSLYKYK